MDVCSSRVNSCRHQSFCGLANLCKTRKEEKKKRRFLARPHLGKQKEQGRFHTPYPTIDTTKLSTTLIINTWQSIYYFRKGISGYNITESENFDKFIRNSSKFRPKFFCHKIVIRNWSARNFSFLLQPIKHCNSRFQAAEL